MIDVATAGQLLDFGARMGKGPRADEQLQGAVAIHNILQKHRVAYLADEVGMGKTYVALGALALFRHFQPGFRVLVIAPRENIQRKWMKELGNFSAHNLRFADLRVVSVDRQPVRPLVACDSLIEFVRESVVDPNRDFFLRLSSFSLALGGDNDRSGWARVRDDLRREVPWLPESALDLRGRKDTFKDTFARAVCCALPVFDLVIVDEGHNLKHGFRAGVAARNRVLALAFGHPSQTQAREDLAGYGPRAKRVLFLSATPIEEAYQQIWNQLDVFGMGKGFKQLTDQSVTDEQRKEVASRILIRRVTTMRVAGDDLTKNQYRREWQRGGVRDHDAPMTLAGDADDRKRLVVALVQKKVAELLGSEKFNMSYQIGMLASFESFLETTGVRRGGDEERRFDIEDQTEDEAEREGIDVRDINRLARNYRDKFGAEMPHPKMDALVDSLADSWTTGRKALVFVRRIKSVDELKRKLDERYDDWLLRSLRARLPKSVLPVFENSVQKYRDEKNDVAAARQARAVSAPSHAAVAEFDTDDQGGTDTFFAWFFRGKGPAGIVSGANIQRRFIQKGTAYSTFFEDNYVMSLLEVDSGTVVEELARICDLDVASLKSELTSRAAKYLTRVKRHQRADRFAAFQAAALELLKDRTDALGQKARTIWHEVFETSMPAVSAIKVGEIASELEQRTFFTEIRRPERALLRAVLWPEPVQATEQDRFRERQLRAELLSSAGRLGHSLIDLYVLTVNRLGSLNLRTLETDIEAGADIDQRRIDDYLDLLEFQRVTALSVREWGAFDELADIAHNFHLILDVNAPEARLKPLQETARNFGGLLRQQQPVAGMSGQVNRTVVQQFRMPGYPLALITTDLLQEGEDLHTFCSAVYHYGIGWTPSSMEQRIGRIDRVRSQTDRRLSGSGLQPNGDALLQVYYPHLEDTVEVLQVRRVLNRMNVFLRLMHEGLAVPQGDHRRVDVRKEMVEGLRSVERLEGRLKTAFPIQDWALEGSGRPLASAPGEAFAIRERFTGLGLSDYPGLEVEWPMSQPSGVLLGTVRLPNGRVQPFALSLRSEAERLIVRCVSPIGRVTPEDAMSAVEDSARTRRVRLGAIVGREDSSYDLTVEDDVVLGSPFYDVSRVGMLLKRVAAQADALEQVHLPSHDQKLAVFEQDLRHEGRTHRG
jgi:hypothetical protein